MTNNIRHKHMAGNIPELAVFRIDWRVTAWIVANGVAGIAIAWVIVNEPTWLLVG